MRRERSTELQSFLQSVTFLGSSPVTFVYGNITYLSKSLNRTCQLERWQLQGPANEGLQFKFRAGGL